ncbi:ornithine decarboxylase 2-like [Temnothorax nylanderi]|uniref:ornithine decarboxylase 2-like n=1 Tax=Temnothorax nylanderi TaxID=102681 RepID=UPI003A890BB7
MSHLNYNEIKIIDDEVENTDIIKDYVKKEKLEDAFYIADIGGVIKKHQEWISKLPKVVPHYAIKCNSNATVIKVLTDLNACFDCESKEEIAQVRKYNVQGERIIFANPNKLPSHIKYAKEQGVALMTADNALELIKIKDLFPEAKIVIRVRCDADNSPLGAKFGCEPYKEAKDLIQHVQSLGLNLHGFTFQVGTSNINNYLRGIEICKQLIEVAKSYECNNVQLIDIGGNFPGGFSDTGGKEFNELATLINAAIENLDPNIRVISEPGKYYVESNFTLASFLHSKKLVISDDNKTRMMYYTNCGVYNSFLDELLGVVTPVRDPNWISFSEPSQPIDEERFLSYIWGPTTDPADLILKDVLLPELYIGDWLVWSNMGAYTLVLSNTFNGFPIPAVKPFIRKSQWLVLLYLHKKMRNFLKQRRKYVFIPKDRDEIDNISSIVKKFKI